jgi:hypothetical protein
MGKKVSHLYTGLRLLIHLWVTSSEQTLVYGGFQVKKG